MGKIVVLALLVIGCGPTLRWEDDETQNVRCYTVGLIPRAMSCVHKVPVGTTIFPERVK
jgi:hypothetical protein